MNLLIHDLPKEEWEKRADQYKDWTVISEQDGIRPCIGCFRCWTGGDGRCAVQDGYGNMGDLIHQAEEVVIMSRYTWGGFSAFVKNVFDRCLGYVLPEFETAYGEMHHKKRYPEDKPVTFCFRGNGLTETEKEKARSYVAAVCRNLRGRVKDVIFEEFGPEANTETSPAETERSGILLINCSLRKERSNTGVLLQCIAEELGSDVTTVSLESASDNNELAAAVSRAETVVLGIPLYVDGLPSSAIRFLNAVHACGEKPCRVYAVVNNGLYESRQNENLLNMIKDWSAEKGYRYSGALAVGAGEVIGTLMRDSEHVLWPARNALSGLKRLGDAVKKQTDLEDIYADPFLFPRWLYILIANTNWQRLKAAEKHRRAA